MDFSGKITLQSIGEFIKSKLSGKSDNGHKHSRSDITDFPSALPASGGTSDRAAYSDNSDMLDGHHEDYFAKSVNPTIDGSINLVRTGNSTTNGSIFAWEETVRIRNQDPNAGSTTYTDLIVTPLGIFCEKMLNGSIIMGREKILTASDIPTSVENADKLDGYHADDFAKSSNPSIYGGIRLTGGSSYPSIFPYGDTIRIRNINDETIENHSYTDLVITPSGAFIETKVDGAYQGSKKILTDLDMPIQTGEIRGMSQGTAYSIGLSFTPVAVLFFDISYNHHVNGGFSLSLWENGFTITPSNISTMGTSSVKFVAFRGVT